MYYPALKWAFLSLIKMHALSLHFCVGEKLSRISEQCVFCASALLVHFLILGGNTMDENKEMSFEEQIVSKLYLEIHKLIKRASALDDTTAQQINREVQQLLIEKHSSTDITAEETLNKIYDIFINNAIFAGPNEDFIQLKMKLMRKEMNTIYRLK